MGPVPRQLNFDQSLYISLYGAKSMPFQRRKPRYHEVRR